MENQDKLFEQFKEIAHNAESKEFPSMDKVWSRVEDKLDRKAVEKSAGFWKIIAVAASVLLFVTIGYQFLDSGSPSSPDAIEVNKIVTAPGNTTDPITPAQETSITAAQDVQTNKSKNKGFTEIESAEADASIAPNDQEFFETGKMVVAVSEKPSAAPVQSPDAGAPSRLQTISGVVSDKIGSLPGANIVVMGTNRGTKTDVDGKYSIEAKEGEQLVFSFVGMKEIVATVGDKNQINAKLPEGGALLESVMVNGYKGANAKVAANDKYNPVKSEKSKSRKLKMPTKAELRDIELSKADADKQLVANVEFLSNAPTLYIIDGVPSTEAQFKQLKTAEIASMKLLSQSEATSLYGKKAVNGAMVVSKKEAKSSDWRHWEKYDVLFENAFESPVAAPLSTFKLNVETTSYNDIRNFINKGVKVPKDAVRIEEMINYFEYRYPQPEGQNPVSINTELSSCPWNGKHKLVKIGIQGKNISSGTIVDDAKIQIEFNPALVKSYRLIGYEKRKPRPDDFKGDTNAGGLGGGHTVTALYEVIPNGVESQFVATSDEDLKYTKINTGTTFGEELATIKFRYKKAGGDRSIEMAKVIENKAVLLQNSSNDFRFCAAVAWFGLKLRESELIGNRSYAELLKLAKGSLTSESEGSRSEFVRLVEAVK